MGTARPAPRDVQRDAHYVARQPYRQRERRWCIAVIVRQPPFLLAICVNERYTVVVGHRLTADAVPDGRWKVGVDVNVRVAVRHGVLRDAIAVPIDADADPVARPNQQHHVAV